MAIWQAAFWLLQVVLFVVLGALQFVEKVTENPDQRFGIYLQNTVVENRLSISILVGLTFALITGWKDLLYPRKRVKEIRQAIMEAMLEELFDNDKVNLRITIFKDANFLRRCRIYIRELWYGTKGAFRRFDHYVFAWERLGGHLTSRVYLRTHRTHEELCRGVAGVARFRQGVTEIYDLPQLTGIDLDSCNIVNSNRTAREQKVYRYLKKSYLKDDIGTLKRIHRNALHIYGDALSNNQGQFKGVLVIDSFKPTSPFSVEVRENLSYYLKLIAATL